jgi:hypothetical protein
MAEDDVLDEYGLPAEEYKVIIQKFCVAHTLRHVSVDQLVSFCGNKIFNYIHDYENQYYHALLSEKMLHNVRFTPANLNMLGFKAIPICIPFAAFCLKFSCIKYIKPCEKIIVEYHIAHQLYDDLIDVYNDLNKPDGSWIIKSICAQTGRGLNCADDVYRFFKHTGYDHLIINMIKKHLKRAKIYARQLKFNLFIDNINHLGRLADSYHRIKV